MPTNGETLTTEQSVAKQLTLTTLEGLGEDPMKQFKVQFHEGYDLEEDILYNTWKVLKEKVLVYLCQILQITTQNIEELNNSFQRDITATSKVSQEAYKIFSVFSKAFFRYRSNTIFRIVETKLRKQ